MFGNELGRIRETPRYRAVHFGTAEKCDLSLTKQNQINFNESMNNKQISLEVGLHLSFLRRVLLHLAF